MRVMVGGFEMANLSQEMEHSRVVSTHLWNTPLNLYQKAKEGFLSKVAWRIAWGVL